jgi:hypothetical protein
MNMNNEVGELTEVELGMIAGGDGSAAKGVTGSVLNVVISSATWAIADYSKKHDYPFPAPK